MMKMSISPAFQSTKRLLDEATQLLRSPRKIHLGLDLLHYGLRFRRDEWSKEIWQRFCESVCRSHPVRNILNEDPITARSNLKPRGYPGDAVLLDFIYRHPSVRNHLRRASSIGKAICEYKMSSPSAESVRWRRDYLAELIDETVMRNSDAEILSVACGHLREAEKSMAIRKNLCKRFIAFDQDAESLATIRAEKYGQNIECIQGTIRDIVKGGNDFGKFDLIYSAGLYDYLNDEVARLLTKKMCRLLKDGGRLLIANFLPGNKESGYMEAFMDWGLIYRSREEFLKLVAPDSKCEVRSFCDELEYVVYVELQKKIVKTAN